MKRKKNIIIILIIALFVTFLFNIIPNYSDRNSIKIVINPLTLNGLYYYEIKSDRTMTVCFGTVDNIDPKISSSDFRIKIIKKNKMIITEEEYNNILELANQSINYGNIEENISLDGCYAELYYKGITQRIYNSKNGYCDLYKLLLNITSLAPEFIDIKKQISGIDKF